MGSREYTISFISLSPVNQKSKGNGKTVWKVLNSAQSNISVLPLCTCHAFKTFLVTPVDNERLISPSRIYCSLQSFSHSISKFDDRY